MLERTENSLNLFKIYGIQVAIHHTWIIVFLLVAWSLSKGYYPHKILNLEDTTYWVMGGVSSFLLFACVLLHELSHSIVAIKNGMKIKSITLFIFGGVAHIEGEPNKALIEFKIAIAGPVCSIALGIFFFIIEKIFNLLNFHPAITLVLSYLFLINITLAVFNLIPGFPLDGGRILRAFFWMKTKNFTYATEIATKSGKIVAFLLITFGAIQIISGSLTGGVWFILIGLFLQFAAQGSYQQVVMRENLRGLTIGDVMRSPVVYIDEDFTIDQLVEKYFLSYNYTSFPVLINGGPVGMITLDEIKRIPKDQWPFTRVSDVFVRLPSNLVLKPEDNAFEALNKMSAGKHRKLPVVQDGVLVGIVTYKDLLHFIKLKSYIGFDRI